MQGHHEIETAQTVFGIQASPATSPASVVADGSLELSSPEIDVDVRRRLMNFDVNPGGDV